MQTFHTATDLSAAIPSGKKVVLVPTMGGLHEGHLALVRQARNLGDIVIVSIYVNPLQFGVNEDFDSYPRDLTADCQALSELADIVYAPTDAQMYPEAQTIGISLPSLADQWCGKSRPGFFHGITVVVCKLFNQIAPNIAVFGQKDYQQAYLIKLMVRQLNMPITIHLHPTVRHDDGLAMSSRNRYLSQQQRQRAPQLYQALQRAATTINDGSDDFPAICLAAKTAIAAAGMTCDYFTILSADTLGEAESDKNLVILTAAQLGKARLIDNLEITRPLTRR